MRRRWIAVFLAVMTALPLLASFGTNEVSQTASAEYIQYVEFNVPKSALQDALNWDIRTEGEIGWVELLARLACRYGGEWSRYAKADLDALAETLLSGESIPASKYLSYYREAYQAVLGGLVGDYQEQTERDGVVVWEQKYGLKAFYPIASGYEVSHYDDFGVGRSYGYQRRHLGHDMMGQTGTPIIAVESGTVEVMGWNQYGGWRIGIRSADKKRYWYYAHLRKDHPFRSTLKEGDTVTAGEVIGYMGRTGYSPNENVNNIETTHLHIGLELIFDESQKESDNEIWVDLYALTSLLAQHRSAVERVEERKEYIRQYQIQEAQP
ncbi:MAG: M23 family metallopeptidase [Butyricicoccaceae bacterium]